MDFIDRFFNAFLRVFYVGIFMAIVINMIGFFIIVAAIFGWIKF